jgi:hypothetical protein
MVAVVEARHCGPWRVFLSFGTILQMVGCICRLLGSRFELGGTAHFGMRTTACVLCVGGWSIAWPDPLFLWRIYEYIRMWD